MGQISQATHAKSREVFLQRREISADAIGRCNTRKIEEDWAVCILPGYQHRPGRLRRHGVVDPVDIVKEFRKDRFFAPGSVLSSIRIRMAYIGDQLRSRLGAFGRRSSTPRSGGESGGRGSYRRTNFGRTNYGRTNTRPTPSLDPAASPAVGRDMAGAEKLLWRPCLRCSDPGDRQRTSGQSHGTAHRGRGCGTCCLYEATSSRVFISLRVCCKGSITTRGSDVRTFPGFRGFPSCSLVPFGALKNPIWPGSGDDRRYDPTRRYSLGKEVR